MKLGVLVETEEGLDWDTWRATYLAAERLGFESVWISDHVVIPERIGSAYPYSVDGAFPTSASNAYLEPLSTLGFLAGVTRRVRLGTCCLSTFPLRDPIFLAAQWAALDQISHGRMILGACIGGSLPREKAEAEFAVQASALNAAARKANPALFQRLEQMRQARETPGL